MKQDKNLLAPFSEKEIQKMKLGITSEDLKINSNNQKFDANIVIDKDSKNEDVVKILPHYKNVNKTNLLSNDEMKHLMDYNKDTITKQTAIVGTIISKQETKDNYALWLEDKDKIPRRIEDPQLKENLKEQLKDYKIGDTVALELKQNKDNIDIYKVNPNIKESKQVIIQYSPKNNDFFILNAKKAFDFIEVNNQKLTKEQQTDLYNGKTISIADKQIKLEPANKLVDENVLLKVKQDDKEILLFNLKQKQDINVRKDELVKLKAEVSKYEVTHGTSKETNDVKVILDKEIDNNLKVDVNQKEQKELHIDDKVDLARENFNDTKTEDFNKEDFNKENFNNAEFVEAEQQEMPERKQGRGR